MALPVKMDGGYFSSQTDTQAAIRKQMRYSVAIRDVEMTMLEI